MKNFVLRYIIILNIDIQTRLSYYLVPNARIYYKK